MARRKLPPQFVHILKGAAFSLTEKKWQYCQKIFVKLRNGILEDHIIQIALDDIENSELREPLTLYRHIKAKMIDDDLYYILLDEVQLAPCQLHCFICLPTW